MHYQNVCLESFGYSLPDEVVTSEEIESRLAPVYHRLKLPEGRLELMSGIRQRRFWPPGVLPSEISAQSAKRALDAAGIDADYVGALVHGSVCRDCLEPATACEVHRRLGLPAECLVYDVSNACLGILNGLLQIANMIELGQIRAGLVVGSEHGRQLVEDTIAHLNRRHDLPRAEMKQAVASLTIGSASAAILLVDLELSRTGNLLLGGAARAVTDYAALCRGGEAAATSLLMNTDSEQLLKQGVQAAGDCFRRFLDALDWTPADIDKAICHQVGRAHQRALFESLGISPELDFATYPYLGNTGSAALPITAALAVEQGHIQPQDRLALLGIGSGINVIMLGVQWSRSAKGQKPFDASGIDKAGMQTSTTASVPAN